jgi:hypothetical protein
MGMPIDKNIKVAHLENDRVKKSVENSLSTELMEKEVEEEYQVHEPSVSGNAQIEILSHNLIYENNGDSVNVKGVVLKIKNISGNNIGRFVLNIVFYGLKGNIIDIVEFTDTDFWKDASRLLRIQSTKANGDDILSYHVKVIKVTMTPIPIVKGSDKILIMRHSFRENNEEYNRGMPMSYIDVSIRNISGETIATAIFEAIFYDVEGNILDNVRHKELELKPDSSRAIVIVSNKITTVLPKSYSINIVKVITTDVEKVQLLDHKVKTIETGAEEVRGILKNIGAFETDAVLIATFQDSRGEIIGTKAILVRGIGPGAFKSFYFVFDTPGEEKIRKYTFTLTGTIDEIR